MERRRYYTAETLRARLDEFEARFGMGSEAFYISRMRDMSPESVDPHDSFVWADTYREWLRIGGAHA